MKAKDKATLLSFIDDLRRAVEAAETVTIDIQRPIREVPTTGPARQFEPTGETIYTVTIEDHIGLAITA